MAQLGQEHDPLVADLGRHGSLRAGQVGPGEGEVDRGEGGEVRSDRPRRVGDGLRELAQHAARLLLHRKLRLLVAVVELDDALGLDDSREPRPTTPEQTALGEVDVIARQWSHFLDDYADPLTTFGLDWLGRFAPQEVARVSLVRQRIRFWRQLAKLAQCTVFA